VISPLTLQNCVISNNYAVDAAGGNGGGVRLGVILGVPILRNCLIVQNKLPHKWRRGVGLKEARSSTTAPSANKQRHRIEQLCGGLYCNGGTNNHVTNTILLLQLGPKWRQLVWNVPKLFHTVARSPTNGLDRRGQHGFRIPLLVNITGGPITA